jgi:hypothetical protein
MDDGSLNDQQGNSLPRMRAPRVEFSVEAREEMSNWVCEHLQHPFLTREMEDYFMLKYNMTRKQVKTAFNNRRQRIRFQQRERYQPQLNELFIVPIVPIQFSTVTMIPTLPPLQ